MTQKKKILVVEGDVDVRLGCNILLKTNHYDTFFDADGFSVVPEARKHVPDLIILDLALPSVDGFVVLESLRSNTQLAAIPVIVVSAGDIQANKERALKAGARAFVQMPWDDGELLATIAQLVGSPQTAAPSAA